MIFALRGFRVSSCLRDPAVYTARDETDLDALTAELVRVVQEVPAKAGMQPESVSVWLRPSIKSTAEDARSSSSNL